MKYIKKLFGGIDLTWKKLLIFSVIMGVYPGLMLILPFTKDTSFSDIGGTYECWVFLAIVIISNCKKPLEAASKTFVFFLISQPLIYLVQVPFCWLHWEIFSYYPPWFIQTLLTFPGAYIGWYVKKGKWYSLLLLLPMMWLLAETGMSYLHSVIYSFPWHLLTSIFCAVQIFLFVFAFFDNKKLIIAGCIIGAGLLIVSFFNTCYHQPYMSINIYEELDENVHYTGESSDESVVKVVEDPESRPIGLRAEYYKKKGSAIITIKGDDGSEYIYEAILGDEYHTEFNLIEKKNC